MNGYDLSRTWFDFAFENPEKITPTHGILYFYIIEQCNRLGWKEKFGLPTGLAKEAIGIKNYRTYQNALDDLVEWGFIKMIQVSKNQHTSNIVAIVKNAKAHTKAHTIALDKAIQMQGQSTVSIDKQLNNETIKPLNNRFTPPTLNEVIFFFKEKNYPEVLAVKAFEYYNLGNWKDGSGKQVKNWKQKMLSVWMKEENKNYNGKNTGNTGQIAPLKVSDEPFGTFKYTDAK